MARIVAITTKDNPYDPIDQPEEWYNWDESMGYCTSEYLARVAHYSPHTSKAWNDWDREQAIDEIVKFNLLGNYEKIVREV